MVRDADAGYDLRGNLELHSAHFLIAHVSGVGPINPRTATNTGGCVTSAQVDAAS